MMVACASPDTPALKPHEEPTASRGCATNADCEDAVELSFTGARNVLPSGDYLITVVSPLRQSACSFTLVHDPVSCAPRRSCTPIRDCESGTFALDVDPQTLILTVSDDAPELDIEVRWNGEIHLQGPVRPQTRAGQNNACDACTFKYSQLHLPS